MIMGSGGSRPCVAVVCTTATTKNLVVDQFEQEGRGEKWAKDGVLQASPNRIDCIWAQLSCCKGEEEEISQIEMLAF
jgi:hypothetical protein